MRGSQNMGADPEGLSHVVPYCHVQGLVHRDFDERPAFFIVGLNTQTQ